MMGRTFRALRIYNFRLFWTGQLVSLSGTWMQTVALSWLVLKTLHGGGTALGLVVAVQFLPTLFGGPWAGVLADRFDKRHILIATQSSMAVLAAVLAVLDLAGHINLTVVYLLTFGLGVATMFDNPTRQAFVTEMVGKADLANAVALNSAGFNVARIAGPAVAGILIVVVGTGWCFAFNALSFVAVIAGLVAMRAADLHRSAPLPPAKGQVREGLRYALSVPDLRVALGLLALVGTLAMNFTVIVPLVAKNTFHGDAGVFSLMVTIMGLGSLVGALFVASRGRPTSRLLVGSSFGLGVAMLACAVAPTRLWEYVFLAIAGFLAIAFMSTCNATVQLASRSDMRGRVMALYMVLFLGSTPVGGPLVGWIGEHWGARWSLVVGGVGALVAAVAVLPTVLRTVRAARADVGVPPTPEGTLREPAVV